MNTEQNAFGTQLRPLMIMRRAVCVLCFEIILTYSIFSLLVLALLRLETGFTENFLFGGKTLEALIILYLILRWFKNYYIITNDKIIAHHGVFTHDQNFFAIKNVESIALRQDLFGKIFGYGTLKLYAPTIQKTICIRNINSPKRKARIIEKLLPSTKPSAEELLVVQSH